MWGTDMTMTWAIEGQVAVFTAVDHHSAECVGIHAARRGTRFKALEPLRQDVGRHFGAIGKEVARGLAVHNDHGSQYMSDTFRTEWAFWTLKENLLWIRTFDTVEEIRLALPAFCDLYNTTWLIQRLGYQTLAQVRQQQLSAIAVAAGCSEMSHQPEAV